MTTSTQSVRLNRLLQLCSANLPVGGFSFSQGLEYAVETQWVHDVESCQQWLQTLLYESFATTDVAILKRLFLAFEQQDMDGVRVWNTHLLACRESKELRFGDVAMGKALIRLLNQFEQPGASELIAELGIKEMSFITAFALTAWLWELDIESCQSGFCWTFIDSQVAAATKLIPLGQTQAQKLLFSLSNQVQNVMDIANAADDDDIGGSLPGFAMASAWHETQYSRLFRS